MSNFCLIQYVVIIILVVLVYIAWTVINMYVSHRIEMFETTCSSYTGTNSDVTTIIQHNRMKKFAPVNDYHKKFDKTEDLCYLDFDQQHGLTDPYFKTGTCESSSTNDMLSNANPTETYLRTTNEMFGSKKCVFNVSRLPQDNPVHPSVSPSAIPLSSVAIPDSAEESANPEYTTGAIPEPPEVVAPVIPVVPEQKSCRLEMWEDVDYQGRYGVDDIANSIKTNLFQHPSFKGLDDNVSSIKLTSRGNANCMLRVFDDRNLEGNNIPLTATPGVPGVIPNMNAYNDMNDVISSYDIQVS